MHIPLTLAQQPGDELLKREMSTSEITLSVAVLVFTILLVGVIAAIALKQSQGWSPPTTKLFIIVVVVGGSLFLLTAGYSQEQMTPIIGLLGTIVGYALGRKEEKE
jgi:hypothetical protein